MNTELFWLDRDNEQTISIKSLKFRSISGVSSIVGNLTLLLSGILFFITFTLPTFVILKGKFDNAFAALSMGFINLIWCVVFFVDMLGTIRTRKHYHALSKIGQKLNGEIISCVGEYIYPPRGRPNFQITVRYKFFTPQQVELQNKISIYRNDLNPQMLPAPGTTVMILYANDRVFCLL